jgi:hypothetical protein
MAAKYPACRHCRRPVVAGQRDPYGVPAHLQCLAAFDLLPAGHPARRWLSKKAENDVQAER